MSDVRIMRQIVRATEAHLATITLSEEDAYCVEEILRDIHRTLDSIEFATIRQIFALEEAFFPAIDQICRIAGI